VSQSERPEGAIETIAGYGWNAGGANDFVRA
jgi:hypothetical protein